MRQRSHLSTAAMRTVLQESHRARPNVVMMEPDEQLLTRIARGDDAAFESVYDRFSTAVYSLALRMLRDRAAAEEVTQEVFVGIWRGAGEFDPGRGSGRSWILAQAHHKSVDAVRRMRLRATDPLPPAAAADIDIDAEALRGVENERVRQALASLSKEQREAIVLAYYGGYTQKEISGRLRVPLGTVKTRIRDGMRRLRPLLAPNQLDRDEA
ncbi:MAG: sigma-70 family RNA polymerase sigma factor [bacterium]